MPDWMHEEAKRQQELKERERRFVEEQEQRREQRRREELQGELEEHLRQRGMRYQDHTGLTPTRAQLRRWQEEYVDAQEIVYEAEAQQRRDNFDPVY